MLCATSAFATTATRLKTWASRENLTATDLNAEFDNIITFLNGSISLVNLDSTVRYRMDTLDVAYGIRMGTTAAATLGNVLWGNGNLFISVSKDSAGIVAETGNQTITGNKTFADTVTLSGGMFVTAEGSVTSTVFFYVRPYTPDSLLIPQTRNQFGTKFYIDSLRTRLESEMYDTAAVVVTTNNGLIRPTFADSAARVVRDTANILRTYTQNTIEDSLNNNIRGAALLTFTGDRVVVNDTLEVKKILDADTLYSSTTINFFKDNVTVADTLVVNKIADIDTLWSSLNKIYVKTALQVKDSIVLGTANILDVISDSITTHLYSLDSVGFSYVIGRKAPATAVLTGADSSTLSAALQTAFTALSATGGTIFIKGGVYSMNTTDSIPSTTKRINIVGEQGKTQIYVATTDYAFYDTLNTGKIELGGGIEWIGTANALGLIRTGTTAATSGDSVVVKDVIMRGFVHASATMFFTDDSTTGWWISGCKSYGNKDFQFAGMFSVIENNFSYSATGYGFSIHARANILRDNYIEDAVTSAVYCANIRGAATGGEMDFSITGNQIVYPTKRMTAVAIDISDAGDNIYYGRVSNNAIGAGSATADSTVSIGIRTQAAEISIENNQILKAITGISVLTATASSNITANKLSRCGTGVATAAGNTTISNNKFEYNATGILISAGTKSGYSENWFYSVTTNISDSGVSTVAGTSRDLD